MTILSWAATSMVSRSLEFNARSTDFVSCKLGTMIHLKTRLVSTATIQYRYRIIVYPVLTVLGMCREDLKGYMRLLA